MRIVSLGEILWDVFAGDRRFLGGAPLNFSVNAMRLGHSPLLISAVGNDPLGFEALACVRKLGLSTELIRLSDTYPTGTAAVSIDAQGHPRFAIHRPAAFDDLDPEGPSPAALGQPAWIYFGTLAQVERRSERSLLRLLGAAPQTRRFYDVNLRDGHWSLELVERLSLLADVMKLNDSEAAILFEQSRPAEEFSLGNFCRYWSSRFDIEMICVTLGQNGCALYKHDRLDLYPGIRVQVKDTVGAGDAFSAGLLHGLSEGWPLSSVAGFANAVGATVASRPGATPEWSLEDCQMLLQAAKSKESEGLSSTH